MAYAIVHHFPSGTEDQYQNALKAVHPNDGESLPQGQVFHIAGEADGGGWVIVAIHEDKASWERFRDETLGPGLQNADGAFTEPPSAITFEVRKRQES